MSPGSVAINEILGYVQQRDSVEQVEERYRAARDGTEIKKRKHAGGKSEGCSCLSLYDE